MKATKKPVKTMTQYTFYWAPEGRQLCTIGATTIDKAKAMFKRRFPAHAQYMGEVYWEIQSGG